MKNSTLLTLTALCSLPIALSGVNRVFSDDFESRSVVYLRVIESGSGVGESLFLLGDGTAAPIDEDGEPDVAEGTPLFPDLLESEDPYVVGSTSQAYIPGNRLPNPQVGLRWRTSDIGAPDTVEREADLNIATTIATDAQNLFGQGSDNQFIFYGGQPQGYRLQQRSYDEDDLSEGVVSISFLLHEPDDVNTSRARLRLRGDNSSDIISFRFDDGQIALDSGGIGDDVTGEYGEGVTSRVTIIYNFRGEFDDVSAAIDYPTPGGGTESLPGHRADVWINGALEMDNVLRGASSPDQPVRITWRDNVSGPDQQLLFLDDWQVFNGAIVPESFLDLVETVPIVRIDIAGDNYRLFFRSEPGLVYQAEAGSNGLLDDAWVPVGEPELGDGGDEDSILVPFGVNRAEGDQRNFYRIRVRES
jgi:hypothetical protein